MPVIKFASLKISVPIGLIQQEVTALEINNWQPHMNRYHYEGEWNVLSLRSPGGNNNPFADAMNNEEYADTSLMQQCPLIRNMVNELQCEKLSVRLLNLHPGAVIKEHTDKELYFEKGEARLHFPVFTNPEVEFYLDNIRIQMQEGECWYINANLPHRLANKGSSNRIHLVIDCKVNDWLQHLFQNDFIKKEEISDAEAILRDRDNIEKTIVELRRQSNKTTNDIADRLEQQLRQAEHDYNTAGHGHLPNEQRSVQQLTNDKLTGKIISFIRSIGITVLEEPMNEDGFLPGMMIKKGALLIDKTKLKYPGDLLHEAGHIAVTPAEQRAELTAESIGKSKDRAAEEMMTIAWSWAACMHLSLDPEIVFHKDGYKGEGQSIVENFGAGRFFGTPMLQWCGMTIEPKNATGEKKAFPSMIKWMRD